MEPMTGGSGWLARLNGIPHSMFQFSATSWSRILISRRVVDAMLESMVAFSAAYLAARCKGGGDEGGEAEAKAAGGASESTTYLLHHDLATQPRGMLRSAVRHRDQLVAISVDPDVAHRDAEHGSLVPMVQLVLAGLRGHDCEIHGTAKYARKASPVAAASQAAGRRSL